MRSDLTALGPRLDAARRQVVAAGGLESLPERMLAEYRARRGERTRANSSTARALADRVDRVVLLGSGSERLAAEALLAGCCHPYHNELTRSERACKPRLYFIGDGVDNDHWQGLLGFAGRENPASDADTSWAVMAIDSPGSARIWPFSNTCSPP